MLILATLLLTTSIYLERNFIMWFFLWKGTVITIPMGNINL